VLSASFSQSIGDVALKSSPDKIITTGADWRYLREVRKELRI